VNTRFSNWINVYRLWNSNKKIYFDHPKTVSEDGLLIEFAKGDSFMKIGHILRGLEWTVAALFGRFCGRPSFGTLFGGAAAMGQRCLRLSIYHRKSELRSPGRSNGEIADTEQHGK